jgi:hypothetical protein
MKAGRMGRLFPCLVRRQRIGVASLATPWMARMGLACSVTRSFLPQGRAAATACGECAPWARDVRRQPPPAN